MSSPTLSDPIALAEAGYWVFPLSDRRKWPSKSALGGRDWGDYFTNPTLGHAALLGRLVVAKDSATGYGVVLQAGDPVPLVVLDADLYGLDTPEAAWAAFGLPSEPMPAWVRSASGGYHFWWRWDPEMGDIERLPNKFSIAGVSGEIRASRGMRALIVLPGSVAVSKGKGIGHYIAMPEMPPVEELGTFPVSMFRRLTFDDPAAPVEKQLPTEAQHFLDLVGNMGEIPQGSRNETLAQFGQILGRCLGWKSPSDEILAQLHEKVSPLLGGDFSDREFRSAVSGGWKRGSKNRQAHGAASDVPTATEVLEEAVRLFGGPPWLIEVLSPERKTQEYILGIGGSPSSPEGGRSCTLARIEDLLVELARLSGAELDVVVQSPLWVNGKWRKALHYAVMVDRGVDILGMSPSEIVWDRLRILARDAAREGRVTHAWAAERPAGTDSYLVNPPSESFASLALLPRAVETLYLSSSNVAAARRLVKARSVTKGKLLAFNLADIQTEANDPDLLDYVARELMRVPVEIVGQS